MDSISLVSDMTGYDCIGLQYDWIGLLYNLVSILLVSNLTGYFVHHITLYSLL